MIESLQNLNLTQQPRLFGRGQTVNFDLVPRDVHALLFVKRLVHILVRAASEKLCGPPEASSRIPLNNCSFSSGSSLSPLGLKLHPPACQR